MRAVIQQQYGGSELLALADIPAPVAGPSDVVVQTRAAGVDRGTWHLMTGQPYAVRLVFGLRRPKHRVPGRDVSGVVAEVGSDVTRVSIGDEVMGTADGSFAEMALVPQSRVARKPDRLSFEESAALPVSGLTALQAVRDAARVKPGDHVLVIGASGGGRLPRGPDRHGLRRRGHRRSQRRQGRARPLPGRHEGHRLHPRGPRRRHPLRRRPRHRRPSPNPRTAPSPGRARHSGHPRR
jgi:hypothetical protein